MFALADCNNFFVSCERVFRPDLNERAVIVLSNNDGCAIARSNEAKALGINMGAPFFKIRDIVEQHNVAVFSSNHSLYGDMSRRVRLTLKEFVPHIETYSIDEAFLDLRGMESKNFDSLAKDISRRCLKDTGIPVSVGISHTRTLAKIASKLCKQYPKLNGGCYMYRKEDIEKVLRRFPIDDVWGIGRRMRAKLQERSIYTAYDYTQLSPLSVQRMFGITGLRTWRELRGESCIDIATTTQAKQSICNSRSFTHEITDREELTTQVANFAAMTAQKLRSQGSVCREIVVFAYTNRFKESDAQISSSTVVVLKEPTDSSRLIIGAAAEAVRDIFIHGYAYKKAGVIATKILPAQGLMHNLFEDGTIREREINLNRAIDEINNRIGAGAIKFGIQGSGEIKMSKEHQSPRYTTHWDEIPTVKIK